MTPCYLEINMILELHMRIYKDYRLPITFFITASLCHTEITHPNTMDHIPMDSQNHMAFGHGNDFTRHSENIQQKHNNPK